MSEACSKIFKGLQGLLAGALPDDYGNGVMMDCIFNEHWNGITIYKKSR